MLPHALYISTRYLRGDQRGGLFFLPFSVFPLCGVRAEFVQAPTVLGYGPPLPGATLFLLPFSLLPFPSTYPVNPNHSLHIPLQFLQGR